MKAILPGSIPAMRIFASVSATRRGLQARPLLADGLLAAALAALTLLLRLGEGLPVGTADGARVTALLLMQAVPLVWRRSHPWPVMAAVAAAYVAYELADPMVDFKDGVCILFAGYAVARHARSPGNTAVVGVVAAAVLTPEFAGPWLSLPVPREPVAGPAAVMLVVALSVGVWRLGVSQRHIHADAARLRELAERLRAEREISTRRAVVAERARIARDLHDLVAHHVSAIAMQARATADVMSDDPGHPLVHRGVTGIGTAADAALIEMRRLLGLLVDDRDPSGLRPEPSLRHLDRLAAAATAAGCRTEIDADPVDGLPPAVQVSAYRVVQEALTNVLKHAGPTDVRIVVRRNETRLTVTVGNGPPAPAHAPLAGSGLGLIGMRERVALFGGTLRAGPCEDGGWRTEADFRLAGTVPAPSPAEPSSEGAA
ncbi:signal transduction histidine kinase [Streptosporangium becharense]|uniref:histidine kinase n=1 Tax=Streptosporangium becharense TaxID=1816182 RepID=A0A7W9IGF7_9ACTN|nr:histidine kinase [Streptosporangium becharense]MBB2914952.1 signal transduction histidine kinase [Streptosporangium becharense]MBB5820237.1 signal transduction histidine kinase [Streptosporangium becharense]